MPLSARSARHARPSKRSTRRVATALAAALAASTLVASGSSPAQASTCVLLPQLRDATVSQGIGGTAAREGYEALVRGKTAVVKAYLSKPACATTEDRVKVTAATLQVSVGSGVGTQTLPTTITGPVFPELLNYGAAPAPDAPSDPVFAVPGSLLDGADKSARLPVTFTMTVDYEARSALGVPSFGRVTLGPPGAVSGPTVSATLERPSNSLRLLVAVMGDPTKSFAASWPSRSQPDVADGAEDVLLRALQAAGRIGPFKDGVVRDVGGSLGIRYTVAPTVVDVRSAIGADGKFCGTSANFRDLRTQLSSFMNNWQTANKGVVVDKVLGVVWGPNSKGPDTSTCADGYAAVGGNQAWTRLTPDSATAPGNAGNLIVMETIGHNFGSVPQNRDSTDSYHSLPSADAGSRGFNTSTVEPIADAVSPLRYALTGWNDHQTVLRREDWAYTLCRLTPGTGEFCPVDTVDMNTNTTPVGAPAGLAPQVYTLAGSTDGTPAGTHLDTYLSQDTDVSDASATSEYRLVQRGVVGASEPVLSTTHFPVDFRTSEHHSEDEHDHPPSPVGTLEVRFAAAPGAQVFEVYKGEPSPSTLLYRRKRDGAPAAGSATITPGVGPLVNHTAATPQGASQPALSPDGGLLTYSLPGGTVVVKDLASGAVSDPVAGTASSWVSDTRLALVRDGSLYVRGVTRGTEPALGPEQTVYDSTRQVELFFAPAGRPAANPGATHLVTSIKGDLWRIDLEQALLSPSGVVCQVAAGSLAPCHRITTGPEQDSEPAYASSSRLLLTRDGALRALTVPTGALEAVKLAGAGQASASAPFLAYRTGTGLGLADLSTFAVRRPALTSGADASPSLVGEDLAFARTSAGRTDVFTTRLQTNTLTFSASDTVPARLRAGVYATCGTTNYPIFVATPPSAISGSVATWSLDWDGAGSPCTQPSLYAIVNDGIDTTRVDIGTGYGPAQPPVGTVGAIYSPAPGTTVLQYDTEALLGDVPGVPAEELSWHVTGPDFAVTLGFVRGEPTLVFPPTGGWTPERRYDVVLLRGAAVLATGSFTAVADEDHDGIAKDVERCVDDEADLDPTNASADTDADGTWNVSDAQPCSSSVNVKVDLDANSLNTGSNGNNVTLHMSQSSVDLRTVPMTGLAVTSIGNYDVHVPASAYTAVTATSATVKVPRQALQDFIKARQLTGYVPVILTGTGPAGSVRGFDPTDPTFS